MNVMSIDLCIKSQSLGVKVSFVFAGTVVFPPPWRIVEPRKLILIKTTMSSLSQLLAGDSSIIPQTNCRKSNRYPQVQKSENLPQYRGLLHQRSVQNFAISSLQNTSDLIFKGTQSCTRVQLSIHVSYVLQRSH